MNIIVAGSRTITDYDFVKRHLDRLTRKLDLTPYKSKVVVFSGGTKGVDWLGEWWAYERRLTYRIFNVEWSKDGEKARAIRNAKMFKEANSLVAFWDGADSDTKELIQQSKKAGLQVRVILWNIKNR